MYSVLLVDDEKSIRTGIRSIIDWEQLDCEVIAECGNGIEALDFVRSHPVNIVVCDIKMPKIDGIETARELMKLDPKIKVIILTAYSDFAYAQAAIREQVVGFVVKPDFARELPRAIEHAKSLISSERNVQNDLRQLRHMIEDTREQNIAGYLLELATDTVKDVAILEKIAAQINAWQQNYCALLFEIVPESDTDSAQKTTPDAFALLKDYASIVLKSYKFWFVAADKHVCLMVLFLNEPVEEIPRRTQTLCKDILSMAREFLGVAVKVGISSPSVDLMQLPKLYREAMTALSGLHGSISIAQFVKSMIPTVPSLDLDINSHRDRVLESIRTCDSASCIAAYERYVEEAMQNKVPFEKIKIGVIVILSAAFLELSAQDMTLDDHRSREEAIYRSIFSSRSLYSLQRIGRRALDYVLQYVVRKETGLSLLVRETNRFIRENYNREINLDTIASTLHVSNSYLSRLYKNEMGFSIVESINRFRIQVAKELLENPSMRIFEVGVAVGIHDPGYFTHVFTKYAGCSPKEYKARLG